jgi:hypothetical protein
VSLFFFLLGTSAALILCFLAWDSLRTAERQKAQLAASDELIAELFGKWRDSVTTSTVLRLRLMDRGIPATVTREELDGLRKLFEEAGS